MYGDRLNQLDYFDKIEAEKAAEIKRNTKEGTVDINLKLKEKGKQSIGLQGGVSGLAGSFIGLTYQTNNFLGLGETLTFSAQFGDLSRTFQFGFTEPYLFDRPISSGFTIFSSRYQFDQAKQEALYTGQSVSINPQLRSQQYRLYDFCQLSGAAFFVRSLRSAVRPHTYQHHFLQCRFIPLVRISSIPLSYRSQRPEWHRLEHHHTLRHL
jgi:outer membrane translocation and assembly module TamA